MRDRIRTHDLLVRSQTLYPAELRAHSGEFFQRPNDRIAQAWIIVKQNLKILKKYFMDFFGLIVYNVNDYIKVRLLQVSSQEGKRNG